MKSTNQGYVVIACYKNLNFQHGNLNISPHFATIRPHASNITTYITSIVQVANVGAENKVKIIRDAFDKRTCSYYYNSRQIFRKDLSYINKFN